MRCIEGNDGRFTPFVSVPLYFFRFSLSYPVSMIAFWPSPGTGSYNHQTPTLVSSHPSALGLDHTMPADL
jgi:hypothetical protein